MDCRTCQPTLIDLLHGELATDAADAARAHLRECTSCSAAYDALAAGQRFGRTLEIEEPPAAVGERILAMAEAHARSTREQRAAAALPNAQGMWRSLLEFVSRFAMARQVGMVTISLLIVAVGLLSLPELKRSPPAVPAVAGGTVLNPDSAESAVPPAGVQPAERLGLKMDTRAGRIWSKDGLASPQPVAAVAPQAPAANAPATTALAEAPSKKAAARRALDDLDAPLAPQDMRAKRADKSERASGRTQSYGDARELEVDGALARATSAAQRARPSTANATSAERAAFPANEYRAGGGLGAAEGRAAPASSPAEPAPRTGALQAAAKPSAPAGPRSELAAARSVASDSGCRAALPRYERVVAAGPATQEAGEALIEMARCQRSLGQPELARSLLERATRIAAVAPQARQLLGADTKPKATSAPDVPAAAAPPPARNE